MPNKCPICYSDITPGAATWTDDPMLTPNHFNSSCRGIGIIRDKHITELRTAINAYETQFGITPLTVWTPMVAGARGRHINEMREAIENILVLLGIPLADWLSWDENDNPTLGITDWLNGHRLPADCLVRGMHIEELRKHLVSLWKETWKDVSKYQLINMTAAEYYPQFLTGTIQGDNLWHYEETVPILTMRCLYASLGGFGVMQARAELDCTDNYHFSTINIGDATGYSVSIISSFSSHAMFANPLTPPYNAITAYTNFVIDSLIYNFTKVVAPINAGPIGVAYDPWFVIQLAFSGGFGSEINYRFGGVLASPSNCVAQFPYPLAHPITVTSSPFSGIFQRNINDDYMATHGGMPITGSSLVGIYMQSASYVLCGVNGSGDGFKQTNTSDLTINKMHLVNVIPP